jgi:hypothetical protein
MLPAKHREILKLLASKLNDSGINWAVVGSANHAMQGVDVKPNDIDIITNKEGIYKIDELLKEYEVEGIHFKEIDIYSCYYCVFDIDGIMVEAQGGKQNKIPNLDLWSEQSELSEKILFPLDGWKIPAISLRREYFAYKKLGREDRAALIQKALSKP